MGNFGTASALVAVGVVVISTLLLTFLVTTAQGTRALRHKGKAGYPPPMPYMIPFIGHLPQFLRDAKGFLARATAQYGPAIPVGIRLLNRRMTLLKGPENISTLFKSSRYLSSERWLVQVLVNTFGVTVADSSFYLADNTGINNQPEPHSNMIGPEHRIFHLVYKSVHTGLSGVGLAEMERQLIKNLGEQMHNLPIKYDEWTAIPDLYGGLIQRMAFEGAMVSLCGPHILEVNPNFHDDFWTFDNGLPSLTREVPRWLAPKAYKARDKMNQSMQRWQEFAHKNYDVTKANEDKREWEEFFGSRLMRTRHEFFGKMPLSKETIAADDLGLIWAATANSIPAIAWFILEIVQRPELLKKVRQIIAPHISHDPSDPTQMNVDIVQICTDPLLQSIYAEILRVRTGTVLMRVPTESNFQIDGWHFKKDEPIIVSSYDTARDKSVWNAGTVDDAHPLDEFWEERFIIYPDKINSGPVNQTVLPPKTYDKPTFSLDGTSGSWLPYGGGSRMCPGRHFAREEITVAGAMFLTAFDVELLTGSNKFVEPDMHYYMFGTMHPKGPIPARIRKRVF